jgi:hypothetical protein
MSPFTQWVPCGYAAGPHQAGLAAYADRVIARLETVAAGFADSILHHVVRQIRADGGAARWRRSGSRSRGRP